MPRFTVIMPVYNAGDYLPPAIDSVLNQEEEDFELLLVEDGATDGSSGVCDKYAGKDSRIRVFHRHNRGICSSRNFGIENARGEYILFCDHDDVYLPNYLKCVRRRIECETVAPEIVKVAFSLADRWRDGRVKDTFDGALGFPTHWTTADSDYEHFMRLTLAVWDGAYRRDFLRDNGVSFDESFLYGMEDVHFMVEALAKARNVARCNEVCYRHYNNFDVSTSARYHAERTEDVFRVIERERELFPVGDFHWQLARYRRWAGVFYSEFANAQGAPRNPLLRFGILRRVQSGGMTVPSWRDMGCLSWDEMIFAMLLKARMLWVHSLWRSLAA